jgi:hypothetical protein
MKIVKRSTDKPTKKNSYRVISMTRNCNGSPQIRSEADLNAEQGDSNQNERSADQRAKAKDEMREIIVTRTIARLLAPGRWAGSAGVGE